MVPEKPERVEVRDQIQRVFRDSRKTYGYRSIRDVLIKDGIRAGRKLILRLMKEVGLVPGPWKPWPYSLLKKANESNVCQHLLERNFSPPGVNPVWTSDITYIWTRNGWSGSDKPDTALVIVALSHALVTRNYVRGQLMFHSDQGC